MRYGRCPFCTERDGCWVVKGKYPRRLCPGFKPVDVSGKDLKEISEELNVPIASVLYFLKELRSDTNLNTGRLTNFVMKEEDKKKMRAFLNGPKRKGIKYWIRHLNAKAWNNLDPTVRAVIRRRVKKYAFEVLKDLRGLLLHGRAIEYGSRKHKFMDKFEKELWGILMEWIAQRHFDDKERKEQLRERIRDLEIALNTGGL